MISIPDNEMEDLTSKREAQSVCWRAAIQRNLNRPEKGAERSLTKFSEENCKVPYL